MNVLMISPGFPDEMPLFEKIETIAKRVYRADEVLADQKVRNQLKDWEVVRLAGQASMSGPGRNCNIQMNDSRRLLKSVCVPKTEQASIRGILLLGGFQTQDQLNASSPQDWRDTLCLELSNRIAEPVSTFSGMRDDDLSALGGLLVFIQASDQFDALTLADFKIDDLRQASRSLLLDQTGIPLDELSQMTDKQLFDLFWTG